METLLLHNDLVGASGMFTMITMHATQRGSRHTTTWKGELVHCYTCIEKKHVVILWCPFERTMYVYTFTEFQDSFPTTTPKPRGFPLPVPGHVHLDNLDISNRQSHFDLVPSLNIRVQLRVNALLTIPGYLTSCLLSLVGGTLLGRRPGEHSRRGRGKRHFGCSGRRCGTAGR